MPITRKPKGRASASEAQIAALIEKGGRTARRETAAPTVRNLAVLLRIPGPLAERLDAFLQSRLIRVPRQTWILEAILEKLDRETRDVQGTT